MRAALLLTALLAATLGGCISEAPQNEPPAGRIDGAVLDHMMQPYSNVTVHLLELDQTTRTTDLGGFSFIYLEPGFYTLEVTLDGGMDRELVIVENETARIILQVERQEADESTVLTRSHPEIVQLAMPGEHCHECEWSTHLRDEHPRTIEAIVEWDGRHPLLTDARTFVEVELRDGDGTLLLGPLGREATHMGERFELYMVLDGKDLPSNAGSIAMHFRFAEDNEVPHPDLRLDSSFNFHYGTSEATDALTT